MRITTIILKYLQTDYLLHLQYNHTPLAGETEINYLQDDRHILVRADKGKHPVDKRW
jgi:hypothetical protein